jgi:hypothetical protein
MSLPLFKALFPGYVTTTEELGRAMLEVTKRGAPKRVLESRDIIARARGEYQSGTRHCPR